MNVSANIDHWLDANQRALSGELAWLQGLLEKAIVNSGDASSAIPDTTSAVLDCVADQFGLSSFERAILLLCAGTELQSCFRDLCGKLHGNDRLDYPSFSLALSVLPDSHWSALLPDAPLRYWHLIEVRSPDTLVMSRLHLDEHILHFLLGADSIDKRFDGLVHSLEPADPLPPSQQLQAEHLAGLWRESRKPPVVLIKGNDRVAGRQVAAHSCSMLGVRPQLLWAQDIPAASDARTLFARLLTREYLLSRAVPVIDAVDNFHAQIAVFAEELECPVILMGDGPMPLMRSCAIVEVKKPTAEEQLNFWRRGLVGLDGSVHAELPSLAVQFNLSLQDIETIIDTLQAEAKWGIPLNTGLWQQCRRYCRGSIGHLAQRLIPHAKWEDVVLPKGQKTVLRDISRQVRHRATVYDTWGFAGKSERGLGISALFTGESGTGKTMAAEVLAADLGLDLYRIDLSAVVSKYIGETEKNLERLFQAAESSGAILLFDEADALFGKRSEVKDSHDRYANIELAYLLQRMESYRGLSILTSNMKSALDTAFLRRIRFVVQFPFPDVDERSQIWHKIFPDILPRGELQIEQLARLHLAGGNIRNIAMNAAFLAAEKNEPLSMADLAHAVRMEYVKLEKPINEAELGRWQ
ncbi:ATP-binding protein [Desulfopila aestuarii]|uniref:ATPase family associated with various cellular activities (AAA) n=1 Tax=Desulfopila aestuarii DSM 18488 TaxID=1121416 RepID=A0A1M7XYN0_9BACT|nr:AAA family ATPase [Desulfopila aestuarii]SHO44176.1 ATPase family associated with various cellular activities (AAA) [Desulfopila aestuarii DSM 18488]